jgi:hypothetical protein
MTLADHRQEKERKGKKEIALLDWDLNTGDRTTKHTGRSDWDINAARHYSQRRQRKQSTPTTSTRRPVCIKTVGGIRHRKGPEGRHHRTEEGHRRAGPTAAVLLHPYRPPDGMQKHRVRNDQRTGATPQPSLDSRVRGDLQPATQHASCTCAGPPNPPHGTTPRTRSKKCRHGSKRGAPPPGNRTEPTDQHRGSNLHVASTPHRAAAIEPEDRRCRPRRLPTMHRTREFSRAESPAAIRCRPSRHKLSLSQAPSKQRCPASH